MSKKKLTIWDLQEAKRNGVQLTQVHTRIPEEAAACEAAGIDMIVTSRPFGERIREAAPNTFLTLASALDPNIASEREAIYSGLKALQIGGDAVYSSLSPKLVSAMAREMIPVVGHVGYVPYRKSWYGKARAVGKTADEAMQVYRRTLEYQDAGAIGVEMEIVPNRIADEIAKRVDILIMSMGSGTGGDVQFLFAMDVLGTNTDHVPRHAKVYGNLHAEMQRVQGLRVDAFKSFKDEVTTGAYPAPEHLVSINENEFNAFMDKL